MLCEYTVPAAREVNEKDTIFSLLVHRVEADAQGIIAEYKDPRTRHWREVSAQEMLDDVRSVAKGLLGLGVKKGDRVILYAPTSYDWGVVDFACAAIGAISVPIYETDSSLQARGIIEQVNPDVAFASGSERSQVLEALCVDDFGPNYVFNFSNNALEAVSEYGKHVSDETLDEAISLVTADDMLTVVYTSGSTGQPKGAMLSHRNFMHVVFAGYEVLTDMLINPSRLMLFLPLAHCFARYIQFVAVGAKGVVGYLDETKHLLSDLRSFKPTYLLGVPRVFEKVYNAASQKAGSGFRGRVFAKAFNHFVRWSKDEQENKHHSFAQKLQHSLYSNLVGSSIQSALGGKLSYLACGGAPMNADLAHFFNGLEGISFIQGYGMTETAAPCVVNFENANRVGSVGRPGPGIVIRIEEDQEILIHGANVFMGYYNQPDLTHEIIDEDGWLHSGDLGYIDDDGFLYITGRKKDIIITAGGKNVSPSPIEDSLATCPIVSHALVIGDAKPFIAAIFTLEEEMTRAWLETRHLDAQLPMSEIIENEAVRAFIQQYIDKANNKLSRAESVRKFAIVDHDFCQEDGTLTASMKVIRSRVVAQYADLIEDEIYAVRQVSTDDHSDLVDKVSEKVRKTSDSVREFSKTLPSKLEQASDTVQEVSKTVTPIVREAYTSALRNVNTRVRKMQQNPQEELEDDSSTPSTSENK